MSKQDKIQTLMSLADGRRHQIIKPQPGYSFRKVSTDSFQCNQTNEMMTREEISAKYQHKNRMIDGVPRITGFKVMGADLNGHLVTNQIILLPIDKPEIVFND